MLGMKKLHLRWVPHALDTNPNAESATLSHGILSILSSVCSPGFQSVITGDQSWFFICYFHDSIWASSRDEVPERVSQKIDTEKCLISLLWSVSGIHSLVDVPKGNTYHSTFFCDPVVPSMFDGITLHSRRKSLKSLYIHLDSARPHNKGDPLNVFTKKDPADIPPGLQPGPCTK
jgi:hypothetical protein